MRSKRFTPATARNITIEAIGAGGDGVALYEGEKLFIPKTAPGDVIHASITSQNAQGRRGHALEVMSAGPERQDSPCPHYKDCGGCALQHVNDVFYRRWKTDMVHETLSRAGIAPDHWDGPLFLPYATRQRTSLKAIRNGHSVTLGYNSSRSHKTVDITQCQILTPVLHKTMQAMRPYLLEILPEKTLVEIMIQEINGCLDIVLSGKLAKDNRLSLKQNEALGAMANDCDIARISWKKQASENAETLLIRKPVAARFGPLQVDLPPGAFLQASAEGEGALQDFVSRNLQGEKNIIDLFCGCGTLTGAALATGASVQGAEWDMGAINALAAARHPKLKVERRDLFRDAIPPALLRQYDAAILDPPRAGAAAQSSALAYSSIQKIIYISCNPASFARDARVLIDGGYHIQTIQMIDQFVWSSHVEIACVFIKQA